MKFYNVEMTQYKDIHQTFSHKQLTKFAGSHFATDVSANRDQLREETTTRPVFKHEE